MYKQFEHIVNAAFENGIIDELFPDKYKRQRCNYATTIEDIKKCSSRSELAKKHPGSYTIGKRIKGLFDNFYRICYCLIHTPYRFHYYSVFLHIKNISFQT